MSAKISTTMLQLTPLCQRHAIGFYNQYQDQNMVDLLDGEYLESYDAVLCHIKEAERNPQTHSFAVLKNRRFIGVIGFESTNCGRHAYIYYWLGKAFRGRGVASQALEQCVYYARERGIENLFAFVWPDNPPSKNLLLSQGFNALGKNVMIEHHKQGFIFPLCQTQQLAVSELNQLVHELGF